ncbi:radical SAM family heme chaperone HemW [Clostridium massiliamazoniense]|uniref:radical SAM family heme chaperone HemW n=1 Tax=Clostridium massiliamazoniense TaxID=1347366 RepID=UPI0006D7E535|nr:radical SAM family heme chaperone HemW [Clostridium massiliamazoniense]
MKEISLYIHIPFCDQKCFYCDFPSFAGKGQLKEAYIKALIKEMNNKITKEYLINTIFIGGGTPSSLGVNELEMLLKEVSKLNLSNNIEHTMECNPGNLTREKLKIMKEYGVNRISMGLQAVQNTLLKSIGRIHDYDEFEKNFKEARDFGFNNINVDLIFGLPNQSLENWKESLERIIALNPEHISAYSLIIEEGTAFYKLYEEDKLKVPEEEVEREMYNLAKSKLLEAGYYQYEISNYSKIGLECRHNLAYWNMDSWIGVGSAASSYIDNKRLTNTSVVEKYIEGINNDNPIVEEEIINSLKDNMEEFMFMGLRKIKGISISEFEKRFGKSIEEVYGPLLNKYEKAKLIIRNGDNLYLSSQGIEWSNQIMAEFLL